VYGPSLRVAWFAQLLAVTACSQAAVFAGRTMTSYRALELGGGGAVIGLLAACFALVPLLVAIPVGRAVDGRRAIDFLRAGTVLSLIGALALMLSPTLWFLAVGNVVAGLGLLLSAVAVQGLLARRVVDAGHDRVFGLFTVAASVGQLIGPLLAAGAAHAAAESGGWSAPRAGLAAAAAFAFAGMLVAVRIPGSMGSSGDGDGDGENVGNTSVAAMVRTRGMMPAVLASLSLLACVDLITAFLPVLGDERGLSVLAVGVLLALRALASIGSRLLVARLSSLFGRQRLLVVSMLLSALSLAAVPLAPGLLTLGVLMVMAGFLLGIGQPLTMSWVAGLVPRRDRGTALAVRLMGNRAGQVFVPAGAGVVAGTAGAAGVFVVIAVLLGLAGASVALPARRG
jgi:MFS family permease